MNRIITGNLIREIFRSAVMRVDLYTEKKK